MKLCLRLWVHVSAAAHPVGMAHHLCYINAATTTSTYLDAVAVTQV